MERIPEYRSPEEMEQNYEDAKTSHLDYDPTNDGTFEKDQVFPTAFMTARSFAEQTNIPHAKELYALFYEKMGFEPEVNEPEVLNTPHFLELRYLSTEKVLREAAESGEVEQVIELASGFTPHSVSTLTTMPEIKRYIENDFEVNLRVKQDVVNDYVGGIPVRFCPGNILDTETWQKFTENMEDGPVAIFAEGLMMYMSEDDRIQLLKHIKGVLEQHGGFFMHEDILKYHAELKDNPRFSSITSQLRSVSSNAALSESYTQEEITDFYTKLGFEVERIPEDVELSYEKYDEEARLNAQDLLAAGFQMWKLTVPKK